MRLIKFAGSLVEVQREAFVCGSHRVVGLQLLLCVHPCGNPSPAGVPWGTLFTHSTVWKSVRLQIRCSETNVITLTCRFLPSILLSPRAGVLCRWRGRVHTLARHVCPVYRPGFGAYESSALVIEPPVPTHCRADLSLSLSSRVCYFSPLHLKNTSSKKKRVNFVCFSADRNSAP